MATRPEKPEKQLRSDRGFSSWFGRGRDDGARGGYERRVDRRMGEYEDGWGVAQVIIAESGSTLEVHPYGSCVPNYCDWGASAALQFSGSANSSAGVGFQVTLNHTGETEYMQGHLVVGARRTKLIGSHHADGVHRERGCSR